MTNCSDIPSVAIRCLVYNHEKYLRDCLDGIVMQKTKFPYYAVVHDDCSTDGSVAIIKEYQAKYPNKIVPVFENVNCYTTNWSVADRKIMAAYGDAKYIAVCEGDDYWTDPYKLQKQVDFMETHLDYSMCAHETIMKDEQYHHLDIKVSTMNGCAQTDYTFDEILQGNKFHYSSLLFRHKDLVVFPSWRYRLSAGDMVLFRYLGSCGKAHWMPEVMSVYRGHEGSLTVTESIYNSAIRFNNLNIQVLRMLNRYWNRQHQDKIYPIIAQYYAECAWLYTRKSMRSIRLCRKMMHCAKKYNKNAARKYFFNKVINRIFQ